MSADRDSTGGPTTQTKTAGIHFPRHFTIEGQDPYEMIEWGTRTALITSRTGDAVFEQQHVRTPAFWSQQAVNIVASMYFRGKPGSPERESDIGSLIDRVVDQIAAWGDKDRYFRTPEDREAFRDELKHLMVHQKAAFNSPVWFNCGYRENPQCSACFIISVQDSMESILDLAKTEGMLFKHGSGTGSNLSALRGSGEMLNGGGTASGPVSFMKGFDAFAGVIKSGGSCLAPGQPVWTTDGPMRAKQLAERKDGFMCMSWDPPSGRFVEKRARAWLSGTKSVMRLITDRGEFNVSTDHPFRLPNGDTVRADNLLIGTDLHTHKAIPHDEPKPLRVTGFDHLGTMPVYSVEVDCRTADDKTAESGHTFVIQPDTRPDSPGVVVHNTRRAAKMVILNADHPDIIEFIDCKAREEKKAWTLIDAGYDESITGDAYASIFFQNANNSVRVTNAFMKAVADDDPWETRAVTDPGHVVETHSARGMMRRIAEAAHICGDPGMQFDTTVNEWHTCPVTDRIRASNPCSEYMFLDDSACNLASINLMKFEDEHGFDAESFRAAVRTMITAQEIIVGNAGYPTPAIERNSRDYRPLGLGYCNLGALLMSQAVPYDSDAGRAIAGAVTALMTGEAYRQSAVIARDAGGPFAGFEKNREPFLKVMAKHGRAVRPIIENGGTPAAAIAGHAERAWREAISIGTEHGFRNAQATVLAPTGTIGFMMDCDTTGIEPDIALVKYKKLVSQGLMKIVNQTVPKALERLGYEPEAAKAVIDHVEATGTIEGAPHLSDDDLAVFDCAFKPKNGERSIAPSGHIRMIGAAQPFISGAISKTINMPTATTVEEIEAAYIDAWKLGAKSVSIYRDGSKRTQPLTTDMDSARGDAGKTPEPVRRRLEDERHAITHKFEVGGHEGYVTVGMFPDGKPGEIFIVMAKEGSTISGFADAFAQAISYALQYGVPLEMLVNKFCHQRFEPAGITRNPKIRMAKSIVDYIVRWMATKFLDEDAQRAVGINLPEKTDAPEAGPPADEAPAGARITGPGLPGASAAEPAAQLMAMDPASLLPNDQDAPACPGCGSMMLRNSTCYACPNCGMTSGCS